MFGTTQDTEEENLIILWDDTDSSEIQTIPSPVEVNNNTTPSDFTLDLWEVSEQKVEAPAAFENSTFSIDGLDFSLSGNEKSASQEENKWEVVKNESEEFNLDFSNSGTSEVTQPVSIPAATDSFSFGETQVASTEEEILSDSDDMVAILSGTINKLKGRQSVIDGTKSKKMSEVDSLNQEITSLKEEVSILKDEISSLESENDQIEKNVQALESMKGIPTTSAKVHNIKRAPNTKKV